MKKILSLFLILVFALSSCTHTHEDPKEGTETPKEVTYTIYSYASEGSTESSESNNEETVKFGNISQKDFDFSDKTTVKTLTLQIKKNSNQQIAISL